MVRIVGDSLLTSTSVSIHETSEQTLPTRRPGHCLRRSAISVSLGHDVEDHIKHKTSL